MNAVVIFVVMLVFGTLMYKIGYKKGKEDEKINILILLSNLPIRGFTADTTYHLLYVKSLFHKALKEAWK